MPGREKVEVVIVGAGLAGLACAYCLAPEMEVLVVERGDLPGAKNVSGGRLYLNPVRRLLPDLLDEAPWERPVTKERLTIMAEGASVTLELNSQRLRQKPYHSVTVLRSGFDRWLSEQVMERGAMVIPKSVVDAPLLKDGRVVGVMVGEDEIEADCVVVADGGLSFIAGKAGLRGQLDPRHFALGVKEVIELRKETLAERFNLGADDGLAHLFFGSITRGMMGGGFLYTNRETLSLGLVIGLKALMMQKGATVEPHALLNEFKSRPEVAPLIAGGNSVEYSAHIVPEGRGEVRLFGHGILVVGDAAGLALNMGLTVRGMDFALASGALGAQAVRRAKSLKDFSASTLSHYETLLKQSFVLADLENFKGAQEVLENPRLFEHYPQVVSGLLEEMMWIGEGPKEKLSRTALREVRRQLRASLLGDLLRFRKM